VRNRREHRDKSAHPGLAGYGAKCENGGASAPIRLVVRRTERSVGDDLYRTCIEDCGNPKIRN
jgi:hypothetical protein